MDTQNKPLILMLSCLIVGIGYIGYFVTFWNNYFVSFVLWISFKRVF